MFKFKKFKDDCGNPDCTRCPLHFAEVEMIDENNEVYDIGQSVGFRTEFELDKWIDKASKTLTEANKRIEEENKPIERMLQ